MWQLISRPPSHGELCRVRTVISFTAMAERERLRVNPEVMHGASQALSGAAKDLHTRLIELDGQVGDMLGGWRGGSGGAYAPGVGSVASRGR